MRRVLVVFEVQFRPVYIYEECNFISPAFALLQSPEVLVGEPIGNTPNDERRRSGCGISC